MKIAFICSNSVKIDATAKKGTEIFNHILLTIHNTVESPYIKEYFSTFEPYKNLYFISASNAQKKLLPGLPYIKTIYHGIEHDQFTFDPSGGESISGWDEEYLKKD